MLDDGFLHKLDALRIALKDYARGGAGGARRSRALGSSAEFSDFREYAPGDDIRRIDWNAFARFDRLFLKLFMEEQECRVTLLIDDSGSMKAKWQTAVQLTETLCYLALGGGDRVRIAALSGLVSPWMAGRKDYLKAADFLSSLSPGGETALCQAVQRTPYPAGRGFTVLVSDLFSLDGYKQALQLLQYRKQETNVIHVLAPEEFDPQLEGALRLTDEENSKPLEIVMTADVLRQYHAALTAFLETARADCHLRGIPYVLCDAGVDAQQLVLKNLMQAGLIA